MYATFLGFLIVFRINMSIARYWEGRTAAETARIRWADACMCVPTPSVPFVLSPYADVAC